MNWGEIWTGHWRHKYSAGIILKMISQKWKSQEYIYALWKYKNQVIVIWKVIIWSFGDMKNKVI